jgi:hypothetical protein
LIDEIQDRLGIGIVVELIEDGPPVSITARLLTGANDTERTVTGPTEPAAWRELARVAANWLQSNEVTFRTWAGGA